MSALAGIYNFFHDDIQQYKIETIEKVSSIFCTDRTETYKEPGLFFSCAHQYFTKEAVNDISPITDTDKSIIFNADIFLYNRPELIEMLSRKPQLSSVELSAKGDCEIAFLMYIQYGIDFVNMLRGVYSIVIYDKRINSIFLITDHIAGRHLAYVISKNELYYSTTLHVVSALMGDKIELDEEWICAAYMDFSPDTEKLPGRSVYKNIYRLEPGHYVKIILNTDSTQQGNFHLENIEYWNPLNCIKPIKLSSDEEYGQLFRNTFIASTVRMLRARNKHGVLLSGGLDSSSVASVAASELLKNNKPLYSYTQVPCSEYKYRMSVQQCENETKAVLFNKNKYPNIECQFLTSKSPSAFSNPEKYLKLFAQPVKPIVNLTYYNSIDEQIKHDGISIVLNGGSGNNTISYGDITSYVHQKNRSFHFISSFKEASAFCRLYNAKRPKLLKYYIKSRINKHKKAVPENYIKANLKEKYGLNKLMHNHMLKIGGGQSDTYLEWKRYIFRPLTTQHMMYFNTCQSLFTGALYLDPTMTKEIVELCISLPIDCFVKNGKERRAVRDYLKGIVADEILDNIMFFGVQASDAVFRANKYWDQTQNTLFQNLTSNELNSILDKQKLEKLVEDLKENAYNIDKPMLKKAAIVSNLGCFLKNYKTYIEVDKWTKTEN